MTKPARFIEIASNPVPPGGEAVYLNAPDAVRLRLGFFPVEGAARGTVIVLPGRAEFIEKYFEVVGDLQARGFNVAALDWRGQGLSDRLLSDHRKGHITRLQRYIDDLDFVMRDAVMAKFSGPYLFLGHSMGGAVTLRYLAAGADVAAGAVLSAPMTRLLRNRLKRKAAKLLARAAVAVGAGEEYSPSDGRGTDDHPFPDFFLTHNEARARRFDDLKEACPEAAIGRPTFSWLHAAFQGTAYFQDSALLSRKATPTLIVSAREDRIVDPDSHDFIAMHSPNTTLVALEGARHEILMEDDVYRDKFWAAFDEFVEEVL